MTHYKESAVRFARCYRWTTTYIAVVLTLLLIVEVADRCS